MDIESDIVVTDGSTAVMVKLKFSTSSSTTSSSMIVAYVQMELPEVIPYVNVIVEFSGV